MPLVDSSANVLPRQTFILKPGIPDPETMATRPNYSKEEFARRGDHIYERHVRPSISVQDEGKFVVVDIETGSFEIDEDELKAADRLVARQPGAQLWLTRIGSRYAHRFGPRYRSVRA